MPIASCESGSRTGAWERRPWASADPDAPTFAATLALRSSSTPQARLRMLDTDLARDNSRESDEPDRRWLSSNGAALPLNWACVLMMRAWPVRMHS
jgi:hypothetical protein